MSADTATHPEISERRVRREARRIVDDLDRKIDMQQTTLGCTTLLFPLGLFAYLWKVQEMLWWTSALCALGGGFALIMVAAIVFIGVEGRLAEKAVRRFNLRFPERSPHRPLAEAMLADVEPRADGVTNFLAQVVTPSLAPPPSQEVAEPVLPGQKRPSPPTSPAQPAALPNQSTIPLELPSKPRDGEAEVIG